MRRTWRGHTTPVLSPAGGVTVPETAPRTRENVEAGAFDAE